MPQNPTTNRTEADTILDAARHLGTVEIVDSFGVEDIFSVPEGRTLRPAYEFELKAREAGELKRRDWTPVEVLGEHRAPKLEARIAEHRAPPSAPAVRTSSSGADPYAQYVPPTDDPPPDEDLSDEEQSAILARIGVGGGA